MQTSAEEQMAPTPLELLSANGLPFSKLGMLNSDNGGEERIVTDSAVKMMRFGAQSHFGGRVSVKKHRPERTTDFK